VVGGGFKGGSHPLFAHIFFKKPFFPCKRHIFRCVHLSAPSPFSKFLDLQLHVVPMYIAVVRFQIRGLNRDAWWGVSSTTLGLLQVGDRGDCRPQTRSFELNLPWPQSVPGYFTKSRVRTKVQWPPLPFASAHNSSTLIGLFSCVLV